MEFILQAFLSAALLAAPPADKLTLEEQAQRMQQRFDAQNDPVQKAKVLPELSEMYMKLARRDADANRFEAALDSLQKLRDDARTTHQGLLDRHPDPEKHSAGFKQLQIALRESLHRLQDLLTSLPYDQRASFETVRRDLDALNQKILLELFPRRPGAPGKPHPQSLR